MLFLVHGSHEPCGRHISAQIDDLEASALEKGDHQFLPMSCTSPMTVPMATRPGVAAPARRPAAA